MKNIAKAIIQVMKEVKGMEKKFQCRKRSQLIQRNKRPRRKGGI